MIWAGYVACINPEIHIKFSSQKIWKHQLKNRGVGGMMTLVIFEFGAYYLPKKKIFVCVHNFMPTEQNVSVKHNLNNSEIVGKTPKLSPNLVK
jgi:hypothetical protein